VAFFGTLFKTLDGKEFIYKEKTVTSLAEISNRLEVFFLKKKIFISKKKRKKRKELNIITK